MTDSAAPGGAPAPVAPPIVVHANPVRDQAEALARQVLGALALIAAAFGLARAAGWLTTLAGLAGPLVAGASGLIGLAAIVWGQLKTRSLSAKAAAMARALPDSIARVK